MTFDASSFPQPPTLKKAKAKAKDVADATKIDEVEPFEIDRHRLGTVAEALFYSRREVCSGGCFHPPLGPNDQALSLLMKLDLHAVIQCRTVV